MSRRIHRRARDAWCSYPVRQAREILTRAWVLRKPSGRYRCALGLLDAFQARSAHSLRRVLRDRATARTVRRLSIPSLSEAAGRQFGTTAGWRRLSWRCLVTLRRTGQLPAPAPGSCSRSSHPQSRLRKRSTRTVTPPTLLGTSPSTRNRTGPGDRKGHGGRAAVAVPHQLWTASYGCPHARHAGRRAAVFCACGGRLPRSARRATTTKRRRDRTGLDQN